MRGSSFLVFFLILGVGIIGCGSGLPPKPKVFPVKGRVTVNGKPLTGCTLLLVISKGPVGAEDSYVGVLNDEGKFELASGSGKAGAPAGKYKVTFYVGAAVAKNNPDAMYQAVLKGTAKDKPKEPPFPKAYESATTSPKEVEITAESNDLLIAI